MSEENTIAMTKMKTIGIAVAGLVMAASLASAQGLNTSPAAKPDAATRAGQKADRKANGNRRIKRQNKTLKRQLKQAKQSKRAARQARRASRTRKA
jgi:hypothetical protein